MDENVSNSAHAIKKMYDNLSYFDLYGNSIILFTFILIIGFVIYSYCTVMVNAEAIKDDWSNQRCNPKVIPIAGFINKPTDKTIAEFTQENFTYCIQDVLKNITGNAVQPLTYITSVYTSFFLALKNEVQSIRGMMDYMRNSVTTFSEDVLGRILNVMAPLQQIIISIRDAISKTQGILTSALFTALGSYYTLKSVLGAFIELLIIILFSLIAIIIPLWILPFTWGLASSLTAIFLGISIPLAIVTATLSKIMNIQASSIPVLQIPSLCFDKNIVLQMKDKSIKKIQDIQAGDELLHDGMVTATFTLDSSRTVMYELNGIIVSGCHKVKFGKLWIRVCDHPSGKILKTYDEPFIYCLNTREKRITINDLAFTDWDELCKEEDIKLIQNALKKIDPDADIKHVHKYLDSGFSGSTNLALNDGTIKRMENIRVNDILYGNVKVEGIVEIDGSTLGGQEVPLFREKRETKLYHLITSPSKFHIGNIMVYDYNSGIDFCLEKEKILSTKYV
jgi:hypothetical protein